MVTVAGRFGADRTGGIGGGIADFGSAMLTSAGQGDVFVAQLSPAGRWAQATRAGGPANDNAYALALDGTGNAIVAGTFIGTAAFGSTTLTTNAPLAAFVARLGGLVTAARDEDDLRIDYGRRVAIADFD